ncbi:MAG TPA: type III pantothenate kinase [Urbifossiella sp.]|jgi:type III pantothenate kinase
MTPDVVVDIGNSRMKWGICRDFGFIEPVNSPSNRLRSQLELIHDESDVGYISLPNDRTEWDLIGRGIPRNSQLKWVIASVNPEITNRFSQWVSERGDMFTIIDASMPIPISVSVDSPDRVGIDRLMNAIGAIPHLQISNPGIIVDAGTAITVDLIDSNRVFQGGAILPGFQLMFNALHGYTAKLPLINEWDLGRPYDEYDDRPPAKNTENAIVCGVVAAARGAVELLIRFMNRKLAEPPKIIATGGMGRESIRSLEKAYQCEYIEKLTLEGIRIAAESLP